VHDSERRPLTGTKLPSGLAEKLLEWAKHQRQWRAKFMADVGKECGLGAIDLRQRLGTAPLFLVSVAILHGSHDLACNQIEETSISFVEKPKRIQPRDQKAGPTGFAAGHDWQNHRLARRLAPAAAWKLQSENLLQTAHQLRAMLQERFRQRPLLVRQE